MDAANIIRGEKVQIVNNNNGIENSWDDTDCNCKMEAHDSLDENKRRSPSSPNVIINDGGSRKNVSPNLTDHRFPIVDNKSPKETCDKSPDPVMGSNDITNPEVVVHYGHSYGTDKKVHRLL